MRVAILSDPPMKTTGFSVAADRFARELCGRGAEVTYLCIGVSGMITPGQYPYRLWAAEKLNDVAGYFESYPADVALLVGTVWNMEGLIQLLKRCPRCPARIAAHIVSEGLPVGRRYTNGLRTITAVMTGTSALARHLEQGHGIPACFVPQGVDTAVFSPLTEDRKRLLRKALNLESCFLVGVFGRNTERKQQPRVLQALRLLQTGHGLNDIQAYFHCEEADTTPYARGWDLHEVAERLGVAGQVMFPHQFRQLDGCPRETGEILSYTDISLDRLGYCERVAVCDLIVNPSYSGGFEFTTLEAQACGVPVAVTDDRGNMTEVAGEAAMLLPGSSGIWGNGAEQFFVDPEAIVAAILKVRADTEFRERLVAKGIANARRYSWKHAGDLLYQHLCEVKVDREIAIGREMSSVM